MVLLHTPRGFTPKCATYLFAFMCMSAIATTTTATTSSRRSLLAKDDNKDDKKGGKVKMNEELLQKLLDDHGFLSAIYWAPNKDDELEVKSCVEGEWCDVSKDYTFPKDKGQPGRVWESKDYEYNENVQDLPEDKFMRQPVAVDVGIKGLLCVAHTKKGKFEGAVELGLKTDDPVDEDVVAAIKEVIQS